MIEYDADQVRAQADALFNSIGDGAITTDEFGKITRINPTALRILGAREKDMVGQWFPSRIVATDSEGTAMSLIDRPITRAFLTGETIIDKMYYRRKNGTLLPVAVTVSPIILGDRPLGAIEVFRDITLEYEIDRMKSEFISLASHQLRTPLSAIKTYTHMLLDGYMGDLSAPQRRALSTVVGASNRMNELISTLLNITRIESGNLNVAPKSVNIRRLCEEVVRELSHNAVAKDITLELKSGAASPVIKTDNLILKEIVSNLVTNAVKYTPEQGTVTIKILVRGNAIVISVQDTGLGIPADAQAQIFTKFFRAHNVVQRETSGTGLGLYLVKGLTEQLSGKVKFTSVEGQGSTFSVSLPRSSEIAKS